MFPNSHNQREQFENRVIFNKWNLKDFIDVSKQKNKRKKIEEEKKDGIIAAANVAPV